MAQNQFRRKLRSFLYNEQQLEANLTQRVNLHELRFRVTGTLTVAGGAADGALVEDGVARLVESIICDHDSNKFVESIGGRDLLYLTRRLYPQVVAVTAPAIPGVQAGTAFRCDFILPFSWANLANPYDVFWAAQNVEQQLKLFLQFATAKTTAASSAGSGVIITGGDRTVTLNNVKCVVTEVYSVSAKKPQYLPIMRATNSDQFAAANSELPFRLTTKRKVLAHLLQMRQGATSATQDGINTITQKANGVFPIETMEFDDLKAEERNRFPAVPATENGTILLGYAENGKLGTVLDPKNLGTDPQFVFDVDAPTGAPGAVRIISWELETREGVTEQVVQ
jgi:hypothetical protein